MSICVAPNWYTGFFSHAIPVDQSIQGLLVSFPAPTSAQKFPRQNLENGCAALKLGLWLQPGPIPSKEERKMKIEIRIKRKKEKK